MNEPMTLRFEIVLRADAALLEIAREMLRVMRPVPAASSPSGDGGPGAGAEPHAPVAGPGVVAPAVETPERLGAWNEPAKRAADAPPIPRRSGKWTAERSALLAEMWPRGDAAEAILEAVNALPGAAIDTPIAVAQRAKQMGLHRDEVARARIFQAASALRIARAKERGDSGGPRSPNMDVRARRWDEARVAALEAAWRVQPPLSRAEIAARVSAVSPHLEAVTPQQISNEAAARRLPARFEAFGHGVVAGAASPPAAPPPPSAPLADDPPVREEPGEPYRCGGKPLSAWQVRDIAVRLGLPADARLGEINAARRGKFSPIERAA
jgi:hypothetical protein